MHPHSGYEKGAKNASNSGEPSLVLGGGDTSTGEASTWPANIAVEFIRSGERSHHESHRSVSGTVRRSRSVYVSPSTSAGASVIVYVKPRIAATASIRSM